MTSATCRRARSSSRCSPESAKKRSSRCCRPATFSARAPWLVSRCASAPRRRWSASSVLVIEKDAMVRLLHEEPAFADRFISYMLTRNIRIEADLVDQLFNSSEKRLARTLLLLARYGQVNPPRTLPKISQETLAEMIGATRSRVNFFMNKFSKLGLDRVQRRPQNQQLPPQHRPARLIIRCAPQRECHRESSRACRCPVENTGSAALSVAEPCHRTTSRQNSTGSRQRACASRLRAAVRTPNRTVA